MSRNSRHWFKAAILIGLTVCRTILADDSKPKLTAIVPAGAYPQTDFLALFYEIIVSGENLPAADKATIYLNDRKPSPVV